MQDRRAPGWGHSTWSDQEVSPPCVFLSRNCQRGGIKRPRWMEKRQRAALWPQDWVMPQLTAVSSLIDWDWAVSPANSWVGFKPCSTARFTHASRHQGGFPKAPSSTVILQEETLRCSWQHFSLLSSQSWRLHQTCHLHHPPPAGWFSANCVFTLHRSPGETSSLIAQKPSWQVQTSQQSRRQRALSASICSPVQTPPMF